MELTLPFQALRECALNCVLEVHVHLPAFFVSHKVIVQGLDKHTSSLLQFTCGPAMTAL
jgi:hypothetical protein